MRALKSMMGLLTVMLVGCATYPHVPEATASQDQAKLSIAETQRLSDLGFAAGAHAVGVDSLVGVPIDTYRLLSDPDRDTFPNAPGRQKTAWQFQMISAKPQNGAHDTPHMALHLVFADVVAGQSYPLDAQWSVDPRHPTQMPEVFRNARAQPAWVMFPAPLLDRSVSPPRVHFLSQSEITATTPGLPLVSATLIVDQPVSIVWRWRSRTGSGTIGPWTTQTMTVRPSSVFTTASCDAIQTASTTVESAKQALLTQTCGAQRALPSGLRTSP